MNWEDEEDEIKADEQVYGSWTPFKQYSENSHSHQESFLHRTSFESQQRHILLNHEQASSIIKKVFPVGSDTCTNCCHERQKVLGIKLQSVLGLTDVNEIDDLQFARGSPRTLWSSLMVSSSKKRRVKQKSTRWKKTYMGQLWHCFEQGQYDGVLSDSEESEETDESSVEGEMMMEQSSYKFLLNNINGLYISQHGLVFESKDEVDDFDSKMADMEAVLQAELQLIKHQHLELQAKRGEERKLLSQRTESIESEEDQEPTEYQHLDKDTKNKVTNPERKSTFLETLHSAIAKTGWLQSFLDRKATEVRPESDDSDTERDKETMADLQGVTGQHDNHDEFTRQMVEEGGLKYKSHDKTVKQLSYDELPPPLCLGSLQEKPQPDS